MRKHGNQFQLPSKEELDELESAKILFVHGAGYTRQVVSAFSLLSERAFIVISPRPQDRSCMSHFRTALTRASKKYGIKYGSRLLQHDRGWAKVWNMETHVDVPPKRIYATKPSNVKVSHSKYPFMAPDRVMPEDDPFGVTLLDAPTGIPKCAEEARNGWGWVNYRIGDGEPLSLDEYAALIRRNREEANQA